MDQEPAQSGDKTSRDSEIIGFGVRVIAPTKRREEGAEPFLVNYRVDGREKRYTIGSFPEWSVAAARAEAKELRRESIWAKTPRRSRRNALLISRARVGFKADGPTPPRERMPSNPLGSERDSISFIPLQRSFSSQNLQLCSRSNISVESMKDRSFGWSDMTWPAALKIGQVAPVLSPGTPCLTNAPQ